MKKLIGILALLFMSAFGFACPSSAPEEFSPVMWEMRNTMHVVEQEFPVIQGSRLTVAPLGPWAYAMATQDTITVNDTYAWNAEKLRQNIDYDVKLGFHPRLGHCSPAQLLGYHESAHLVDARYGLMPRARLVKRFGDGAQLHGILSGYSFQPVGGDLNPGEALAEAFAAVRCNGGNWAERELNHILTD